MIYSNESQRTWSREGRQTGKPGRIIKKLLAKDYKERDIELFSNQLKAEIMNFGDFAIVSGEDICYWYNSDNYYQISGTLGNSCMRYNECQCYFDVYKDLAKMLICTKDDKLLGRAILWEIDGKTYMDRVYVCMDYLEEQFYQYAMEKGWTIREDNSLLYDESSQRWLEASDNYKNPRELDITLTCTYKYPKFPYMDSFRYFDPETLTLYCSYPDFCTIHLSNTDGYYDEGTEYECPCCRDTITVYDDDEHPWYWSELYDEYICPDCAIYNDWAESYIHRDTTIIDVWDKKLSDSIPKFNDIVAAAKKTKDNRWNPKTGARKNGYIRGDEKSIIDINNYIDWLSKDQTPPNTNQNKSNPKTENEKKDKKTDTPEDVNPGAGVI